MLALSSDRRYPSWYVVTCLKSITVPITGIVTKKMVQTIHLGEALKHRYSQLYGGLHVNILLLLYL
jgi:hypothetical protein